MNTLKDSLSEEKKSLSKKYVSNILEVQTLYFLIAIESRNIFAEKFYFKH